MDKLVPTLNKLRIPAFISFVMFPELALIYFLWLRVNVLSDSSWSYG